MKLPFTIYDLRSAIFQKSAAHSALNRQSSIANRQFQRAFTLIEIAICLAIIGFALVAIIGVLPIGMSAQRVNREQTVINQDASVLMEAIRGGAHGLDYLTNYVYAIVNTGNNPSGQVGYLNPSLASTMNFSTAYYPGVSFYSYLTSGSNIVGLLSTPQFQNGGAISNHIVAYVRSISGVAAEKPPQDNQIMMGDTFNYRVYCVNADGAVPVGAPAGSFGGQLLGNQRELRLTFMWPQLPNHNVGKGHQTYRATIAGQLTQAGPGSPLYFYQSQSFTNAP